MSLTDARAAHPQIEILEEEREKDRQLLEALADWCDRYTPLIAIDTAFADQYGLILDITGCAHLFGGERALMNDLLSRLFHQGFCAAAALAPTPGGAWAVSRYQNSHVGNEIIHQIYELEHVLENYPLAALRLSNDCVSMLARLGLRTIGQLAAQPRAPIARRFGRQVLLRLDQALGAVEEAISPRRPVAELMVERHLAEPVCREEDMEYLVRRLAGHLCEKMEKRGLGARLLRLCLFRVDGRVYHLDVGTSGPERDAQVIARLFGERFTTLWEEVDAGYGFETLRLCLMSAELLEEKETSLVEAAIDNAPRQLMDRLAARIGPHNICRSLSVDTHLPECAEREIRTDCHDGNADFMTKPEKIARRAMTGQDPVTRPLRIFQVPECIEAIAGVPDGPPIRFRWRKLLHRVVRAEGPERIADHWWRKSGPRQTRDYFRVEDENGRRYWLFREGLYGCETDTPKWFLHGLFA